MLKRIFLTLIISIFAFSLNAKTEINYDTTHHYDFYLPAPDRLLENVEKYHLNKGVEKIKAEKLEEAKAEYEFILNYFPNHPQALQKFSEIAIALKQNFLFNQAFERATKLYPNYASTYAMYGVFLQKTGSVDEAIIQYRNGLKLDPKNPEINYNLGLALISKQNYPEALKHAEIAYAKGYPFTGLKKSLQNKGIWKSS